MECMRSFASPPRHRNRRELSSRFRITIFRDMASCLATRRTLNTRGVIPRSNWPFRSELKRDYGRRNSSAPRRTFLRVSLPSRHLCLFRLPLSLRPSRPQPLDRFDGTRLKNGLHKVPPLFYFLRFCYRLLKKCRKLGSLPSPSAAASPSAAVPDAAFRLLQRPPQRESQPD